MAIELKGFEQYKKDLMKALNENANQQRVLLDMARLGVSVGVALSPVKTGKLARGFDYFPEGNDGVVIQNVAIADWKTKKGQMAGGKYPYNLWVNEDWTRKGVSYSETNHSGTPGFFDVMTKMLQKEFGRAVHIEQVKNFKRYVKRKYIQQVKI